MKPAIVLLCAAIMLAVLGNAVRAPAQGLASQAAKTVVVSSLDRPCAIAVQPDTGTVFVSETGAGRVVRLTLTGAVVGATPFIRGWPVDDGAAGPGGSGPMGLVFAGKDLLAVGDGRVKDAPPTLRFFAMPAEDQTLSYDSPTHKMVAPDVPPPPNGGLLGVAVGFVEPRGQRQATALPVYTISSDAEGKSQIYRSDVAREAPSGLMPLLLPTVAADFAAARGVTADRLGNVIVSYVGKLDAPRDSVVAYHNGRSGRLLMKLNSGLHDVVGLAFSPKSESLYAIDLAWMKPDEGGLYRLDSTLIGGAQAMKAVKIAALDRPTALAFAPDGTAYITTLGDGKQTGQVISISGL